jgi:PAS domain S-box-containing protein
VALQESEERFERLVEAAQDYAIFMTDVDGRVTTWNEGAQRLFGYGEAEIVGEDGAILFTPEDRESGAAERELEKARTEGRAEDERWHMRKDGSRFWSSGFVRPALDEEGNLLGFSKVARDLTEHKRAEEALDEVRWARSESASPATCTTWCCRTSPTPCRRPKRTVLLEKWRREKAP